MSPADDHRAAGGRDREVSVAEIAALTARLRRLSAAGASADDAERAAFLADKHALLDRIAAEQHPTDTAGLELDDPERRVEHRQVAQTDAAGRVELPEWMREQDARADAERAAAAPRPDEYPEVAARVAAVREQLHAAATAEEAQRRRDELARWHTDDHADDHGDERAGGDGLHRGDGPAAGDERGGAGWSQ